MNRIIKIASYSFILLFLYIGSTILFNSCKRSNPGETTVEEGEEDMYSSDDEIYDEYFESDEEASEAGVEVQEVQGSSVDPEYTTTDQDVVDDLGDDFSYEADEVEKKQINSTTKPTASTSTISSQGGNYLVVAGSYLIKDNAEKMVDKLKNLGYSGAEIVNFDESQYHSISAGRYSSYDGAAQVASTLKNKGIDCYVHTRK